MGLLYKVKFNCRSRITCYKTVMSSRNLYVVCLCFSSLELTEVTRLSQHNGRLGIAVKKVRKEFWMEMNVAVVVVIVAIAAAVAVLVIVKV